MTVFADPSEKSASKDDARCRFDVLWSLACKDLSMNLEVISLIYIFPRKKKKEHKTSFAVKNNFI